MSTSSVRVLEHLAGTGWFGRHGLVALTTGLCFCLGADEPASEAVMSLLQDRAGVTVPRPTGWEAETSDAHGYRTDLMAWQSVGPSKVPVVVLEAKAFASFGNGAVAAYVDEQRRVLSDHDGTGIFGRLVPAARLREAAVLASRELPALDGHVPDPKGVRL